MARRDHSILVGMCNDCFHDVFRCGSEKDDADFELYCENDKCQNNIGVDLGGQDIPPDWFDKD